MTKLPNAEHGPARASVATFIAKLARVSAERDDWASRTRRLETTVDGVPCLVRVRAEMFHRNKPPAPRVTGDLFVYLTSVDAICDDVGGVGWVHFGVAEDALAHCASVYDFAFAQARQQLRSKPVFASLVEREALRDAIPVRSKRHSARL